MPSSSSLAVPFSRSGIWAAWLLLGFGALGGASSCLFDPSDRCDTGQTYDPGSGLCVCAAGSNTVTGDHGCVPCGEHQVARNDACVCADGYTLTGSTCSLPPEGVGEACSRDQDCTTMPYTTCRIDGDSGYCTNAGCHSSDDCSAGYACNTASQASFCQRPPDGQGKACASNADCAGTAATYCETFTAHTCFVQGCSLTVNDCFTGYECCDLSLLSGGVIETHICVVAGSCKAS